MKKIFVILVVSTIMASCKGGESKNETNCDTTKSCCKSMIDSTKKCPSDSIINGNDTTVKGH